MNPITILTLILPTIIAVYITLSICIAVESYVTAKKSTIFRPFNYKDWLNLIYYSFTFRYYY
jgi:hypothetical protein